MKDVLIGSIFANDSNKQRSWLDLQLRFIESTTKSFDHITLISEGTTNNDFPKNTEVVIPQDTSLQWSKAHLQGLNTLLDIFRERSNDYKYFLFLDGDAFPIKKNWLGELTIKLNKQEVFDKNGYAVQSLGREREIAIALRSENLENRLHASILFAKGAALQYLDFAAGTSPHPDLLGNEESDIYLPTYQSHRRAFAFPLIRSNKKNVNPVACGIYYDCFYHHCCGSGRAFDVRSSDYWGRIIGDTDMNQFTKALMEDPEGFVAELAGWNEKRYL